MFIKKKKRISRNKSHWIARIFGKFLNERYFLFYKLEGNKNSGASKHYEAMKFIKLRIWSAAVYETPIFGIFPICFLLLKIKHSLSTRRGIQTRYPIPRGNWVDIGNESKEQITRTRRELFVYLRPQRTLSIFWHSILPWRLIIFQSCKYFHIIYPTLRNILFRILF